MMTMGWEGKLVRLVPLDEERHFENAYRWINTREVTRYLCHGYFPMTRLAEHEWFEQTSKASSNDISFAIETLGGKHIGFSGLHGIDYMHGTATTGTLIGDPSEWGKGYGTEAANLRAFYAFEILGLRLLQSSIIEGNERSLRMQQRVGYRVAGTIPGRFWKYGRWADETKTYLERELWRARNPEFAAMVE